MAVKCGICCRCGNTSPAHPLHKHLSGRHRLQHPTTTAGNRGKCCRCGSTSPYTPASQTPLGPTPATAPNHNGRESREMLPLQYKKGEKQHHKRPAPIYNPDTPSEGVLLSRKIPTPSEGVHKAHTCYRHTEGHFPRTPFIYSFRRSIALPQNPDSFRRSAQGAYPPQAHRRTFSPDTFPLLLPKECCFPAKSRLLPKECTRRIPTAGTQKAIFPGCLSIRKSLRTQEAATPLSPGTGTGGH